MRHVAIFVIYLLLFYSSTGRAQVTVLLDGSWYVTETESFDVNAGRSCGFREDFLKDFKMEIGDTGYFCSEQDVGAE